MYRSPQTSISSSTPSRQPFFPPSLHTSSQKSNSHSTARQVRLSVLNQNYRLACLIVAVQSSARVLISKALFTWVLSDLHPMDQVHSSSKHPAPTTQDPLPCEVVSVGTRINTKEWAFPTGGKQARPACFGIGQFRIPERSKSDRLCSACMSLDRLDSTYWEEINNFREVIVDHHNSFDALLKSARGGCHLCVLILIAWEDVCRLEQETGGGWVGKLGFRSVSLNDGSRLSFKRIGKTLPHENFIPDEVQITILCGDLPHNMRGRLICKAMDSECSSFSSYPASHESNQ